MKKINLTIASCKDCPYCHYNSYYSRSSDSGYDCSKTMKRIVNDWDVANDNNPNPAGWPSIPNWCPLENSP